MDPEHRDGGVVGSGVLAQQDNLAECSSVVVMSKITVLKCPVSESVKLGFIIFIIVLISLRFYLKPKQNYIMCCCFVDKFTPTSLEWVYFCLYSNEFFARKVN